MSLISGCTDGSANNFNSDANVDDGSCTYDDQGCTDETADNYNSDANVDDGSCEYPEPVGTAIADCGWLLDQMQHGLMFLQRQLLLMGQLVKVHKHLQ